MAKKKPTKKAAPKEKVSAKAKKPARAVKAKAGKPASAASQAKGKAAKAKKPSAKAASAKAASAKKPSTKAASAKKPSAKSASAKKPSAQAAAKPKAAKPKAARPKVRRDATGHLEPSYEKDLRKKSRENLEHDDDRAFLVGERADDALAQELGTEFVETVTSGEDEGTELRDEAVPEEQGGPFVPSTAGQELADEPDESNPLGSSREPFPKS